MFTVYDTHVIIEDSIKQGGGTFTLDGDGISFDSGYMVSVWGYEHQITLPDCMFPQKDVTLHSAVGQYMQYINHAFSHTHGDSDLTSYIGTWVDEGVMYLDVSRNVDTLSRAERLAQYNRQLAIYDCTNKCVIRLDGEDN